MSIGGINIPNLGNVTNITNVIGGSGSGVSTLGISGLAPVSGNVLLASSGDIRLSSSGNTLVIGIEAIPNNLIYVQSLNDLPIPVANAISLQPNKVYRFAGIVDIGNNYLLLDESTCLNGGSFRVDGITSTWTGSMINSTNRTVQIESLSLNAPSGFLFSLTSTGSNRIFVQNNQLSGCINVGLISGIDAWNFSDNRCFAYTDGIKFRGPCTYGRIVDNRFTAPSAATTTGITIFSGANQVIGNISISDNLFLLNQTGQTCLFVNSGAVSTGILSSNVFGGSGIVIGGGFSKGDPAWDFSSNTNLADSKSIGSLRISGNVTATPFTAQNQFVPISGFSITGLAMERFRMSNSGTLQYYGIDAFAGTMFFNGYFTTTSATNISWGFAFTKNGIVINDAYFETFTTATGVQTPVSLNACVNLQTNDTIGISATNRTSTVSLTLPSYTFVIQ